ncbi:MAG: TIM-barrel domain-containing protein [bacterium]
MKAKIGATLCIVFFLLTPGAETAGKSNSPPVSPHWVFDHLVWEDDENTERALWNLIDGYTSRGIPVGAVIIDSPWSVEYNDFVFNRSLYPDPEGMIKRLHQRGIKAILWMTCMLNKQNNEGHGEPTTNNAYREALEKGYLANGGQTFKWWKGVGGFIDYTNPEAVKWWHGLMDRALDLGFDGWKVDGAGVYFPDDGFGKKGAVRKLEYKDMYYTDTYEHTVSKNPDAITLSRSVDILPALPGGFAPVSHAPATWVGDEKHDWSHWGFQEALRDVLDAGRLGYAVVGSDIGGYHGDEEITRRLLIRWAQFGAFCTLMENGGHGKHQPWRHDDETVEIYRKLVKTHLELKPYFYSLMMRAHREGGKVISPKGGKYQYLLGDALFVAPIYDESDGREVKLPKGAWRDFWDNGRVFEGGASFYYSAGLDRFPVFVRDGAIIPLAIEDGETGRGTESLKGKITLDIYPRGESSFAYYDVNGGRADIKVASGKREITINSGASDRGFVLKIFSGKRPAMVELNGAPAPAAPELDGAAASPAWFYDADDARLWISLETGRPNEVKVLFPGTQ